MVIRQGKLDDGEPPPWLITDIKSNLPAKDLFTLTKIKQSYPVTSYSNNFSSRILSRSWVPLGSD